MPPEPSASPFWPWTDWVELGKAAEPDEARLDQLIRLYWQPLKVYLLATFPALHNEAEVLLQEFAEDKLLKTGWLQKADRQRGRFRDFLKTSLRNFVLDRLNLTEARNPPLSIDQLEQDLPQPDGPSEEFDLSWARTVLAETLRRMEADCKHPDADQPRRGIIWEFFRVRLLEPIFNDVPSPPYEELVARFELKSPMEAANTLLSAKRIFKAHLTNVIREYARQDTATELEIGALEEFLVRLAKRK